MSPKSFLKPFLDHFGVEDQDQVQQDKTRGDWLGKKTIRTKEGDRNKRKKNYIKGLLPSQCYILQ